MKIDKNEFYTKIKKKLGRLRKAFASHYLLKHFLYIITIVLFFGFFIFTIEGFLYLKPAWREGLITALFVLSGFLFSGLIVEYILIRLNKLKKFNDQNLARLAGANFHEIGDSLLNSIQLWTKKQKGFSKDLINENLKITYDKIKDYNFKKIVPGKEITGKIKLLAGEILIFLFIFLLARNYYLNSMNRIFHPQQNFPVPHPFTIENISQETNILGGDTVRFQFQCKGSYPEQINLNLRYEDYQKTEILPVDSGGFSSLTLPNVRRNIKYEAYVENSSIFIPWSKISSGLDSILVTDRPEIIAINSRIDYPAYTGKPDKNQDTKKTEYFTLPGSRISFHIRSNKELEKGRIIIDDSIETAMNIDGKSGLGGFKTMTSHSFYFKVFDPNGVSNIKPIEYKITTTPDKYPSLTVMSPESDIRLNEAMNIPVAIRVGDDFGLSALRIKYQVIRKYEENQNQHKYHELAIDNNQKSLQEVFYDWDLNQFNLSPEDKVQFSFEVFDNDRIRGPKKTESRTFTAIFPSLHDLYSSVQQEQEGIYEKGQEIINQLKNTKQVLDKAHRKLLKNNKLTWEQNKQVKDELQKTEKLDEQIKKISEKIDKVLKKAEENNLFDEKTLQKYMKLQETFQEIMSPELKKAMRDLQQAVDQMDPQKTKKALDKFRVPRDDFEQELDRQLELFKKIKTEQAMDELVKRLQDLAKRQNDITDKLDTAGPGNKDKLSKQEADIETDTEIAQDIMKRTIKDMDEIPLMPSEKMQNLLDQMENKNITGQMKDIQKKIQNSRMQEAQSASEQTQSQLQQFQKMMEQMREDYRKKSMDEIAEKFHKIIKNSMTLSKEQENINQRIKNTPAHSSRLMDVAVEQQRLRDNLNKLLDQMSELSKQTLGLSSKVSQMMGQSYNNMSQSIRSMEQRNTHRAAQRGKSALKSLNTGSKVLLSSLRNLQSSGSSTGFENYMKQLQKMANQQKQLNQQTRNMQQQGNPQMSLSGNRKAGLQQLAARQQQIRESLNNLQKKMQGKSKGGGKELEGAGKDMEKVIEDLKNNKILQKTLDRQNRILTRMLDAQKSLRTQGYKKQRKSTTGEDMEYTGPSRLPSDLGEKKDYLRQRLEEALNNNYSREYEELIRLYFEELSQEQEEKEKSE
jgi:hypothetical protein